MKAAMFRNDGMGAVVGRLKNPNEVQYEDNGSLKVFHLTGAVVDTEYNDVLILGKKLSDTELEVQKMESLPKNGEEVLGFKGSGDMGAVYCLAIPVDRLTDTEEKKSESGSDYRRLHFVIDKKNSLFLTLFGAYDPHPANECMVFLLREAITKEEHEYGTGFAVKQWTTKYGVGYQVMS